VNTVLNLYGPINRLGFGVHFTHWAGTLASLIAKEGNQVSVTAVHQSIDLHNDALKDPAVHATVMRSQDLSLFNPRAPSICLWQLPWVTEFAGSKRIFYTTFEGTLLSPLQQKALTKVDQLWVTSHWHEQMLLRMKDRGGVPRELPIHVVPEGVDQKTFYLGDTGLLGEWGAPGDEETVRFVSVGKLEARKGMRVAVQALANAASLMPSKKMLLLCHWHNPFLRSKDGNPVPFPQAVTSFLHDFGFRHSSDLTDTRSVRFANHLVPNLEIEVNLRRFERHEELISIYRFGHFGLFPTFSEGWNLPLHESMACGLPPITNAYSGQTEYLQQNTFIPCGPGVDVIAKDEQFFRRGDVGTWREIRVEELSGAIQIAAHMTPEERKALGERASKAALIYTWDRAAHRSLEILRESGDL